ncbi:ATP-dependent helicase [Thermococcus sp. M39]|uniref:UvrD-helicase domain-containing protein n=1 Tax=Thermococcus sp. M39 TaxID=1638262 RepID=UPI00143983D5|nr:ATP-dependent helicase [Thermococcus sp. M39]NJE06947.1 ATP-dependent helicase [Thermococcus sp. M39]
MRKIAVIGPPGTGKTSHLLSIIKYLTNTNLTKEDEQMAQKILRDSGELRGKYRRENILFLTFTTSAQNEAIKRITGNNNYTVRDSRRGWAKQIRTVHSLCWTLIKEGNQKKLEMAETEYERVYFAREASMLSKTGSLFGKLSPIAKFCKEKGIPYDRRGEKQELGNLFETIYTYAVNSITEIYKSRLCIGDAVKVDALIETLQELAKDNPEFKYIKREYIPILQALIKKYTEWKVKNEVIDYPDTILRAFLEGYALEDSETFRNVRVMIIDEAQDLSRLQWALVRQLIGTADLDLVIVAGDPLQSIYSFQAADFYDFIHFILDAEKHVLDESYRLTEEIQKASLTLVAEQIRFLREVGIHYKFKARGRGGKVKKIEVLGEGEEVIREIVEAISGEVVSHIDSGKTVFILTRTNDVARRIEKEFYRLGITVKKIKNAKSLYEEIEDIIRIADAIKNFENYSFDERVELLDYDSIKRFLSFTVFADLLKKEDIEKKEENRKHVLNLFISAVERHSVNFSAIELVFAPVHLDYQEQDAVKKVLAVTPKNIVALLKDFLENPYHYIDFSRVSAKIGKEPAELMRDYVEGKFKIILTTDRLFVDTMHASKGSEADVVFVIDYVNPIKLVKAFADFELRREEERVYYVAMTRAREKLVIVTTGPETSFLNRASFVLSESSSQLAKAEA